MRAAETTWFTRSRTVQSEHGVGSAHWCLARAASAARTQHARRQRRRSDPFRPRYSLGTERWITYRSVETRTGAASSAVGAPLVDGGRKQIAGSRARRARRGRSCPCDPTTDPRPINRPGASCCNRMLPAGAGTVSDAERPGSRCECGRCSGGCPRSSIRRELRRPRQAASRARASTNTPRRRRTLAPFRNVSLTATGARSGASRPTWWPSVVERAVKGALPRDPAANASDGTRLHRPLHQHSLVANVLRWLHRPLHLGARSESNPHRPRWPMTGETTLARCRLSWRVGGGIATLNPRRRSHWLGLTSAA